MSGRETVQEIQEIWTNAAEAIKEKVISAVEKAADFPRIKYSTRDGKGFYVGMGLNVGFLPDRAMLILTTKGLKRAKLVEGYDDKSETMIYAPSTHPDEITESPLEDYMAYGSWAVARLSQALALMEDAEK